MSKSAGLCSALRVPRILGHCISSGEGYVLPPMQLRQQKIRQQKRGGIVMSMNATNWGLLVVGVLGAIGLHAVFTWIFVIPAFVGLGAGQ